MPKISEFEKQALEEIDKIEKELKEAYRIVENCRAQISAYKSSIEWYKNTRSKKKVKTNVNTK